MALKFAVNNSLSAITSLPSGISGGALNLISTQTASGSASLEFSLDDSYDSYVFKFINIHPATDNQPFTFQGSTDGGSNYNTTMTNTLFRAYHYENDSGTALQYRDVDQAQGTSFQNITDNIGSDNDQCCSGILQIFNPSSTTFVKHFMFRMAEVNAGDVIVDMHTAGYFNTISAITNLKFQFSSGNIDDGIIKMYGVS